MGVDPEHVLEQDGVASLCRVEEAHAEEPLEDEEQKRDGKDRRGEKLDPGRGVDRPGEQRQALPCHAGRPQPVDRGQEVHARERGRKPDEKDAEDRERNIRARPDAVGNVEGPARVRRAAARKERGDGNGAADDEQPPREDVDLREGHVARADLERHDEVPERRRDAGNDEEEDHDHAVEREDGIVGLGGKKVHARPDELEPHGEAERHADNEEGERRDQVEQPDPLVVGREDPAEDAGVFRFCVIEACFHAHHSPFCRRSRAEARGYELRLLFSSLWSADMSKTIPRTGSSQSPVTFKILNT